VNSTSSVNLLERVVGFYKEPRESFLLVLCVSNCVGRVTKYLLLDRGLGEGLVKAAQMCGGALAFLEIYRASKNFRLLAIVAQEVALVIWRSVFPRSPEAGSAEEASLKKSLRGLILPALEVVAALIGIYSCGVSYGIISGVFSTTLAALGFMTEMVLSVCAMVKTAEDLGNPDHEILDVIQHEHESIVSEYNALRLKNLSDRWYKDLVFVFAQFVELLNIYSSVGSGVVESLVCRWSSDVILFGYGTVLVISLKQHLFSGARMKEIEKCIARRETPQQ